MSEPDNAVIDFIMIGLLIVMGGVVGGVLFGWAVATLLALLL